MSKLSDDLRTATLAVAGGVFTSSVFLLVERVNAYYTYKARIDEEGFESYGSGVENLWWIPVSFWHALMFVVAAFIAHRYFASRSRSPFLLWQKIGGMALLGWALSVCTVTGLECLTRGNLYALERMGEIFLSWSAVKFVAVVCAGNVMYGSLIQGASRQYVSADSVAPELGEACQEPCAHTTVVRLDDYQQRPRAAAVAGRQAGLPSAYCGL